MIETITAEIAKLELQEGDVLLVRIPPNATKDQHAHAQDVISNALKRAGIERVPILMGSTDTQFEIIRKGAA